MIALVLAQIAARWGQAATLLVLSVAATVAAAGVPGYAASAEEAAARHEVATAGPEDLVVSLPVLRREQGGAAGDRDSATTPYRQAQAALSSFEPVTTVDINVQLDRAGSETYRLAGRDGFCRHVVFRAGRCPVGSREVALPARLAELTGLRAGDRVTLTPVVTGQAGPMPDGPPVGLTVVGIVEPADRADPYWAVTDPFGEYGFPLAALTNRTVLRTFGHGQERVTFAAVLPPDRLTPDAVPALRRQLTDARSALPATVTGELTTRLPGVLDAVATHGTQARTLLPIAAAPLLALCWFVIYLTAGHAVAGRRREVGVIAVRGVRPGTRATAVAAEHLLPVLAGVPAGLALLPLLLALVGPGGGTVAVDPAQLAAAALAGAGGVAAVLVALRRELSTPVARLLRQVPPRRRAAVAAVEVGAVLLAVIAVVELRILGGDLTGVMVAAPALVIVAVAVLAARTVRPLLARLGRGSLRRGRLGPGLAGLYLARLPGAGRLLIVLALAFGTLGFAVTTVDVTNRSREVEAGRSLGAPRVLDVQPVDRARLLAAVRAADPQGRYAMAAVSAPGQVDEPARLALDTTRLAPVASWPDEYGAVRPADLSALLRPPAPAPVWIQDGNLTADLLVEEETTGDAALTVTARMARAAGDRAVSTTFEPVTADRTSYRTRISDCPNGCRLTELVVRPTGADHDLDRFDLTLRGLHQDDTNLLADEWLTDSGRWRVPEQTSPAETLQVSAVTGGIALSAPQPAPDGEYVLRTGDAPYPLPVVTTGDPLAGSLLTGIDNELILVDQLRDLPGLPGLGAAGVLMDFEYAERLAAGPGVAASPQVWLTADAPPSVVDRLEAEGLVVTADRSLAGLEATVGRSGAALALRFHLVTGAVAVLVGLVALLLVATVDRGSWATGLRGLRVQGLPERATRAASWWAYGTVVVVGAVIGAAGAAAGWLATGRDLPAGVDPAAWTGWPAWTGVVPPLLTALLVLLAAAVGAGRGHRAVIRGTREGNG